MTDDIDSLRKTMDALDLLASAEDAANHVLATIGWCGPNGRAPVVQIAAAAKAIGEQSSGYIWWRAHGLLSRRTAARLTDSALEAIDADDEAKMAERGLQVAGRVVTGDLRAMMQLRDDYAMRADQVGSFDVDNPGNARRTAQAAVRAIDAVLDTCGGVQFLTRLVPLADRYATERSRPVQHEVTP